MKNYIWQAFALVFGVFASLVLFSFIKGEASLLGYTFKPVDLFSDVAVSSKTDSLLLPAVKPKFVDTCKTGLTCFEDYSNDTTGLSKFFEALDNYNKNKKGLVRIAYFGDSFIEGDILTAPLRDTLQQLFGGNGVGFVPITSDVAGFRTSVIHSFSGWQTYSAVGERSTAHPLGLSGHCFTPMGSASVTLRGANLYPTTKQAQTATLYYRNAAQGATANINLNQTGNQSYNLVAGNEVNKLTIKGPVNTITASVSGSADYYGIAMEDSVGISLDNFGLRGNAGYALLASPDDVLEGFAAARPYDLIVIHYGLNAASAGQTNFTGYENQMVKLVEKLKKAYPNAAFLLVSISDRSVKKNGAYETMDCIPPFIEAQRRICQKTGISFWNFWQAMGGEGSMAALANAKPALANKDYTHIKFSGGRYLAKIFAETLLYEKLKYENRKKAL